MLTEYHFPTPVYIKEIPNAVKLNHHLEKQILKWNKEDPKGVSKTNAGGWHSTTDMNKKQEYDPLSKELFNMQDEIFQKEYLTMKPVEDLIDLICILIVYFQECIGLKLLKNLVI